MFIGRTHELSEMQRRYERNRFECIILYGRRRVGKTALIREFCQDKHTIFFTALETTAKENLQNFSQCIYAAQGGDGDAPVYADFPAALSAITSMARDEKLVLVIDEYPYLAKAYPGISSLYILPFSHSYSVFRSFSKQQDCLMLGFFDISCQKPQAGAICAYSKQNVVP